MQTALSVINIISSILLVVVILLQNRGTGLSSTFGGEGNVYRAKRGVEKLLSRSTIVLIFVFLGSALANLFI